MQVEGSRPHGSALIEAPGGAGGPSFVRPLRALASWPGVALALLAGVVVFWGFDALPFQDLPAHAGLIALRHRYASSAFDRRFFVLADHLGPYSLFRWLGDRLAGWMGPLGAVRVLATLPFLATPIAVRWARARLHGDRAPAPAFYAIALGLGFMTLLGFASYLLAIAALLVVLTLWLEALAQRDAREAAKREACIVCLAPLLFLAHGDAFVLFLAVAVAAALAGDPAALGRRLGRMRAFVPACGLAAVSAWRDRVGVVPAGSAPLPRAEMQPHFQGLLDKLSLLFTPTLMTRWGLDAAVALALWGVVGAALGATARTTLGRRAAPSSSADDATSRAHVRALLAALLVLAAGFAVLPHSIGWFGFVDGRLVSLWLLVALLAVRRSDLREPLRRVFDLVAPVLAFSMIAIALAASSRFQAEAQGWRDVEARVPADSRVLNVPLDPNSDVFTGHPFVHYDKLILADRPAVVSDIWFHQGTGLYPTPENPALGLPASYVSSDLHGVDWAAYRLEDWDYVLVRTRPSAAAPMVPPALETVVHRGGWWLFRTPRSPLARASIDAAQPTRIGAESGAR